MKVHMDSNGVPLGARITGFRAPQDGEWYIAQHSVNHVLKMLASVEGQWFAGPRPIVEFDNLYKRPLEDVTVPYGYELDGDISTAYRFQRKGDFIINPEVSACDEHAVLQCSWDGTNKYLCVRPVSKVLLKQTITFSVIGHFEDLPTLDEVERVIRAGLRHGTVLHMGDTTLFEVAE